MNTSFSRDCFPTTRWSVMNNAGNSQSPLQESALNELCSGYWFPLYAYARHVGAAHADAEDLVQAFFSHFLAKNNLQDPKPERGRFRAFLLACFKHHSLNEWKRVTRQKRGGGADHLPLDWATADEKYQWMAAGTTTPERAYDRAWLVTLLERVREQLGHKMDIKGKRELFEVFEPFLTPVDRDDFSYRAAAKRLKLSREATRKAAERLLNRYGELIRHEIRKTCDPAQVEDEIQWLLNLFSDD